MMLEIAAGIVLALSIGLGASVTGLERDRALYPVMLVVIASYYVLFAVLGSDMASLPREILVLAGFGVVAVTGFRTNLWIVAGALTGHGAFDMVHSHVVVNAVVPAWWPAFCASFDVVAGLYLAARLARGGIRARGDASFTRQIAPYVQAELAAAAALERSSDPAGAFRHLERAHVLGQMSTVQHVRVHVVMLVWALRHARPREVFGQIIRIAGAAAITWLGLVPPGNTGGANISAFKPMPIPDELARRIAEARAQT